MCLRHGDNKQQERYSNSTGAGSIDLLGDRVDMSTVILEMLFSGHKTDYLLVY